MCIPIHMEPDKVESLAIYICKKCGERSLKIDGIVGTKKYQPDGWGCDCKKTSFEVFELDTSGEA